MGPRVGRPIYGAQGPLEGHVYGAHDRVIPGFGGFLDEPVVCTFSRLRTIREATHNLQKKQWVERCRKEILLSCINHLARFPLCLTSVASLSWEFMD